MRKGGGKMGKKERKLGIEGNGVRAGESEEGGGENGEEVGIRGRRSESWGIRRGK